MNCLAKGGQYRTVRISFSEVHSNLLLLSIHVNRVYSFVDYYLPSFELLLFCAVVVMQSPLLSCLLRQMNLLCSVLQFYGLFIRPPHVGLVMEYCPKGSLDRFIRPPSREHKSENNAEVKARLPQVTTTSSTQLTSVMLTDGSSGNKIQQENYRDASSTRECTC